MTSVEGGDPMPGSGPVSRATLEAGAYALLKPSPHPSRRRIRCDVGEPTERCEAVTAGTTDGVCRPDPAALDGAVDGGLDAGVTSP